VLALFFRTPPLRAKSALQEAADDEAVRAKAAADEAGALVAPFDVADVDARETTARPASVEVAAPSQPLTRRQLREAQQQ
ncbi:MAG: hypothetical protein J0I44_10815, partial [Microbacterium sp.]|nr:hypothetical protein [Microbacterium sp.]